MENKLEMMVKTENKPEKRLITAALPYVNNIPHLGHIVGSHLPADKKERYSRAKGYDTIFVGGSDENGTPCEIAAEQLGVPINKFLTTLYKEHKKIYDWFEISYDNFSRTSKKIHHDTTKEFFKPLYENGYITKGKMKVFYSPSEKRFLPDRYIQGECPKCNYKEASGDQCEKCTTVLDPSQLINPKSRISGGEVEIKEVEHLFLRLDKLSPKLEKWVNKQTRWRKQVSGIAHSWIDEGLRERAITRDLKHGVKVPLKGFEDKVFYVWFDAPIGYISSTKEATKDWEQFWKQKDSKIYNFLGKDNIPFHTIFWPAMIIGNENFNLPTNVIGLQYLNYEGGKFSKSKNRGVFCEKLPKLNVPADVWRAYLTQIIPETNDSEFRWEDFQERVNSDLIGNFANFYNRSITFIKNKLNGEIQKPKKLEPKEKKLISTIEEKVKNISTYLETIELRKAYSEVLALSSVGNKYFNDAEPWKVAKENPQKASEILYLCAHLGKTLAKVASPFIPETSQKIWKQLGLKGSPDEKGKWDSSAEMDIPEKHKIGNPEKLFSQITDKDIKKYKKITSKPTQLKELF